jgi:hypothetical protein
MSLALIVMIVLGIVLSGPFVLFMVRRPLIKGGVTNGLVEIIPHALMSDSEKRFYEVLQIAAPSFLICPQVAKSATVTRPSYQNLLCRWLDFDQKQLDFVLVDHVTLMTHLVIQLDNHCNRQTENIHLDKIQAQPVYPCLRVQVSQTHNVEELSAKICIALGQR